MDNILKILKTADDAVVKAMKWIVIICTTVIFLLLIMNVCARYLHIKYFPWWGEIVELCFAWLVFFGAAVLWHDNEHFRIEWIMDKIKNPIVSRLYKLFFELLSLSFFVVMLIFSIKHTMRATSWTPVLNFSVRYLIICVPISSLFLVIYSIRNVLVLIFPELADGESETKKLESDT